MNKKIVYSFFVALLLIVGGYAAERWYTYQRSIRQSNELLNLARTAEYNMDLDYGILNEYKTSKDPWVRSNYAGVLGSLGRICKKKDLDFVMRSLNDLMADSTPQVRQAAMNAKASIYSTRRE